MGSLRFENVVKSFVKDQIVINEFNLDISDGEFVVLVGPSGCGKSTLLRIVAGLEEPTSGNVYISDKLVNNIPPKDRDIAMVFQNYALYPHMKVFDNLAFGLKLRREPKAEIEKKVQGAASILGIKDLLNRKPKELSGGQRQRVAVGRAIVRAPQVFLFDEPLSNLDAKLRVQMRAEIKKLHKQLNTTIIYVTHDQVEAMTMGERIVILKDGIVQQIGSPLEVFQNPTNLFVASFIGSPAMNLIRGKISDGRFASNGFSVDLAHLSKAQNLRAGEVIFGIRPEDVYLDEDGEVLSLLVAEPLGNETILHLKTGETTLVAKVRGSEKFESGESLKIRFDLGKACLFDSKTEKRIL